MLYKPNIVIASPRRNLVVMILQRLLSKMEIYFALELENMDLLFCIGLSI